MGRIIDVTALSQKIKSELFPHVANKDWGERYILCSFVFGYRVDKVGIELDEIPEDHDILIYVSERSHSVYVQVENRAEIPFSKEIYDAIFQCVIAFLDEIEFDGFLEYAPYEHEHTFVKTKTNTPGIPLTNNAQEVQELSTYLSECFFLVKEYGNYFVRLSEKAIRKSYHVMLTKKENKFAIKLSINARKSVIIENKDQLFALCARIKQETLNVQTFMNELANSLIQQDPNSVYDKEKESLLILNKRIPFYAQVLLDGTYRGRAFYETIETKDFEQFKKEMTAYATNYMKKNRLKSVLEKGVLCPKQKFYYQLFGQYTKDPYKMLKKRIKTSMTDKELYAFIEFSNNQQPVALTPEEIQQFKQKNKLRHTIQDAYLLGDVHIYRSASVAFIEKK